MTTTIIPFSSVTRDRRSIGELKPVPMNLLSERGPEDTTPGLPPIGRRVIA